MITYCKRLIIGALGTFLLLPFVALGQQPAPAQQPQPGAPSNQQQPNTNQQPQPPASMKAMESVMVFGLGIPYGIAIWCAGLRSTS
jgi:hypothetical protein